MGFKRVQTGENECKWVRMGALGSGGHGRTQNKARRDKNGNLVHDLGTMAGEISPDIMFWEIRQKMSRMSADGCRWVRTGADACIIN